MIKHTLAIVLFILSTSTFALGQPTQQVTTAPQQTASQLAAKTELNEAARAYKVGKFAEAQRHSERALELDPANRHAPVFIARSIQAQYRNGDEDPENVAIAHDAIAAYDKLLLIEPENKDAFKAIVALYEAIGENELKYSWIQQRALNKSLSTSQRVDSFVILASTDRNCAYRVTGTYGDKQFTRTETGDDIDDSRTPKEQKELFDKAQQCAVRGLEVIESAIALDPEFETTWFLKTNLLLATAKLSEMEGNENRGKDYRRLAKESDEHTYELTENRLQALEDGRKENGNEAAPGTISGGVLNGKAISKPQPPFPAIARTAYAQGTIVVQILVDEEGKINSASAVSGHPLLRAAAVQAARQARFSPTMLNGRPSRVSGVLFYNFTLP